MVKKKLEMSNITLIKKRRIDAPDVNRLAKNAALAGPNASARGRPEAGRLTLTDEARLARSNAPKNWQNAYE